MLKTCLRELLFCSYKLEQLFGVRLSQLTQDFVFSSFLQERHKSQEFTTSASMQWWRFRAIFTSTTRVLRRSGQFSLMLTPSTNTRAPTITLPLQPNSNTSSLTSQRPMPSLIRRKASTTCG